MDWDRLRVFHTVATSGSLTAAGQKLSCSQSAVSRQIRQLEDSLGLSLFTRHARGLELTQEGRELFQLTQDIQGRIQQTERRLHDVHGQATGLLRLTTVVTFGAVWLTPHLKDFMINYPNLNMQLILADEDLDLASGDADIAIRLHEPDQNDLIARPLVTFHAHMYASPDYIERKGTPLSIEDLEHHDLITFGASNVAPIRGLDWIARLSSNQRHTTPRLKVNNLYGILHAVEAGMGIAVLPDYLVHSRQPLIRLLPQVTGTSYNSYFCYPPELKGSKRVSLLYEFLLEKIRIEANRL